MSLPHHSLSVWRLAFVLVVVLVLEKAGNGVTEYWSLHIVRIAPRDRDATAGLGNAEGADDIGSRISLVHTPRFTNPLARGFFYWFQGLKPRGGALSSLRDKYPFGAPVPYAPCLTNSVGRAFSKPPLPYISFMMTFHP